MTDKTDEGVDGQMGDTWSYAMKYLSMGWSILPIRFNDKKPAIEWKRLQEVAATEEEVTSWFEDGVPDGNGGVTKFFGLAVITGKLSNLVVVDCDNQDALTYAVNEANLFSMLTVATTRGQHLYFRHPGGGERVQNKAGGGPGWPAVPGLDLRGDGGYVVAPPSLKFGEDGSFKHRYTFNVPMDEIENFFESIPVWPGIRIKPPATAATTPGDFNFSTLNLSGVAHKSYGETVWSDMLARVQAMGRKLRDGDGRNPWLVRYVGECVSTGMDEGQARIAAEAFESAFFDPKLPTPESEAVIASVISSDKRNHPEKYAALEAYNNKNQQRKGRAEALKLIRPNNLHKLHEFSAGKEFFVTPFIAPQSIIQVVGFNGHGKSLWLLNMLWAAARGESFGSAMTTEKLRILYLDFEGSVTTLSERVKQCESSLGVMDDNLYIWNANAAQEDMCLNDGDNIAKLAALIDEVNPQVVVIDTVRQAWAGMEENSPHSWLKVNDIAMQIRNAGMSVILVHHRNKPNLQGHGREAGSTAQLKDLDLQIQVTKITQDTEQAKREAAMPDSATSVTDSRGVTTTAWDYLRRTLKPTYTLRMVFELSFAKQRQATENHVVTYVGMAEDQDTGLWTTVSSLTPIQKALLLRKQGKSVEEISEFTGVSRPTVKAWINKSEKSK